MEIGRMGRGAEEKGAICKTLNNKDLLKKL